MKRLTVLALVLFWAVPVFAQEVVYNPTGLSWSASPFPEQVANYKLYERTGEGVYEVLATCIADVTYLYFGPGTPHPDGTYSWVVTVTNLAGIESEYSNEKTAVFVSEALPPPTDLTTLP